jgi:DNA-binding CsgD family transcriptional regulator
MELLERDDALASLRDCMAAATAGGVGRVVLVAGEAGIGKTSLLRELSKSLAPDSVWWGSCDALGIPNPLAPLHDIARSVDVSFAPLLDGAIKVSTIFGEIVRELQSAGPVLMVIEDAHWADESTLDLIRFLGRRIDRTQAVLAVTFRQDELPAAHPLRTVIGDLPATLTTRIDLPRLSPDAVTTLAHGALRSAVGVHAATGGNPFFVTELLRHGSAEVPQSVNDLVLARFARLGPKAREVVQLVAIVPGRAERWLVDEMLAPVAADIEACIDGGLLVVDGAWLRFRHELARVAIEKAMSPPVAEALHASALDVLVNYHGTRAANAARLAHHATHARSRSAVLAYVPAAAAEARDRGAHREAAAHYRTALEYRDSMTTEEAVGLLEAYAAESQASHRLCAAVEAREEIARLLDGTDDIPRQAHNLSQLALNLSASLRNADADPTSRRAIALMESIPPRSGLAHAYRAEAQVRLLNRDCRESIEWGEKAITLAARQGDHAVLAAALSTLGTALLFIDYYRGVETAERGIELALAHGHGNIAASAYCKLGSASVEIFHLRSAERHLQAAIRFSVQNGIHFYGDNALAWLAVCHLHLGRWDEAEVHATEAMEAASEPSLARLAALCALGRLRVRRGDTNCDAMLEEAAALAFPTGTLQRVAPVRELLAECAWHRGEPARALSEASAALELARRHKHAWHVGELSYWMWRAGGQGAPAAECAEPYRLQIAGQWNEAARAWAKLDCPYEQARALAEGTSEARVEALAIFERLGARPAAEAVRRELRESGVRGVPRGPRPSTQRNPRGLTAREWEILELLCQGLRNSEIAEQLFRSVRTVEHHVDAILGKLGAKSRAEVASIVAREGLLGSKLGNARVQTG